MDYTYSSRIRTKKLNILKFLSSRDPPINFTSNLLIEMIFFIPLRRFKKIGKILERTLPVVVCVLLCINKPLPPRTRGRKRENCTLSSLECQFA